MPFTLLKKKQSIFIAIFTINNYIEKNLFEYENMTCQLKSLRNQKTFVDLTEYPNTF